MHVPLWLTKRKASRQQPNYKAIISDPRKLAEAITKSRSDGSSETVRAALASEGRAFLNNERLIQARREALVSDPSPRVRSAALNGLFISSGYTLAAGIYPTGTREAMELALRDPHPDVRMGAKMHLKRFDLSVRKVGMGAELPRDPAQD